MDRLIWPQKLILLSIPKFHAWDSPTSLNAIPRNLFLLQLGASDRKIEASSRLCIELLAICPCGPENSNLSNGSGISIPWGATWDCEGRNFTGDGNSLLRVNIRHVTDLAPFQIAFFLPCPNVRILFQNLSSWTGGIHDFLADFVWHSSYH